MKWTWIDDNDYTWEWDGERIYCIEAEEEDSVGNGYPASTVQEAENALIDGGYIMPPEEE